MYKNMVTRFRSYRNMQIAKFIAGVLRSSGTMGSACFYLNVLCIFSFVTEGLHYKPQGFLNIS